MKLNSLEKIILHSIMSGMKNISQIKTDTELNLLMITKTIDCLINKELIANKDGEYFPRVSANHAHIWAHHKMEVMDLVSRSYSLPSSFYIESVQFRDEDYQEYLHLSRRLKQFIIDCNKNNPIRSSEKRYIFWGELPQKSIISTPLKH